MFRLIILGILLVMFVGCSGEAPVASTNQPPTKDSPEEPTLPPVLPPQEVGEGEISLTLLAIPVYSRLPSLEISVVDFEDTNDDKLDTISLWNSADPCSGTPAGSADRATVTSLEKLTVALLPNEENLISIKINKIGAESPSCIVLGSVVHDNIAPAVPLMGQTSLNTVQTAIHVPITNIGSDALTVNVYRAGVLLKKINAVLWKNGMGYFTVPESQDTVVTFRVEDRAGNISSDSVLVTISQKTAVIPPVTITSSAGVGINMGDIQSSPSFFVSGTVTNPTYVVEFYIAPDLTQVIATYTAAQFSSGVTITLPADQMTMMFAVSKDIYGNKGDGQMLVVGYVANPDYDRKFSTSVASAILPVKINGAGQAKVSLYNSSVERTIGASISINAATASTSYPGASLSLTGCLSGKIDKGSYCELTINTNFVSAGLHSVPIVMSLDGTTFNLTVEIEAVNPVQGEIAPADKLALGNYLGTNKAGKYLLFTNGFTDLNIENPIANVAASNLLRTGLNIGNDFIGVSSGDLGQFLANPTLEADRAKLTGSYSTLPDNAVLDVYLRVGDMAVFTLIYKGSDACDIRRQIGASITTYPVACIGGNAVRTNQGYYSRLAGDIAFVNYSLAQANIGIGSANGGLFAYNTQALASVGGALYELSGSSATATGIPSGSISKLSSNAYYSNWTVGANNYSTFFYKQISFPNESGSMVPAGFKEIINEEDFSVAVAAVNAPDTNYVVVNENGSNTVSEFNSFFIEKPLAGHGTSVGLLVVGLNASGNIVAAHLNDTDYSGVMIDSQTFITPGTTKSGGLFEGYAVLANGNGTTVSIILVRSDSDGLIIKDTYLQFNDFKTGGNFSFVKSSDDTGVLYYETNTGYNLKKIQLI